MSLLRAVTQPVEAASCLLPAASQQQSHSDCFVLQELLELARALGLPAHAAKGGKQQKREGPSQLRKREGKGRRMEETLGEGSSLREPTPLLLLGLVLLLHGKHACVHASLQ
ncbi:hypothetical protein Esti_002902 [Eimeria stiedai]